MFDAYITLESLPEILTKLEKIIMNQAELAQRLTGLATQSRKAHDEIVAKLAALQTAVDQAGAATPEVEAALADLTTAIQAEDDIVPDATTPPPAPDDVQG